MKNNREPIEDEILAYLDSVKQKGAHIASGPSGPHKSVPQFIVDNPDVKDAVTRRYEW
jgi:hypothetical protein